MRVHDLRTFHAAWTRPSLGPENLLAKFVGKAFRPFGLTSEKTFVEDLVKSLPVAYLLVASGLIDQRDDADRRQAAREKFEDHADAAFAVVLPTPDDVGGWKMKPGQELKAAGFDVDANRAFQT